MHTLIIGGGFGGIAAALRARKKGYEVTLVDRCPRLGGRAQVFERAGFRHDAGPTVLTAPFLFEELFELFGQSLHDHVKLVPLKPWYRFEFSDGNHFDYGGSLEDTLAEIRRLSPEDVDGYKRLLEQSQKLYDIGFTKLSDRPFHSMAFMFAQIPHLARLGAWRTVYQMVCRYLKSDYLRQAFSIQPLLVGGNPFDTTSIYGLIHFLEQAHGVHFAMGGTGALVDALEKLMIEQGIEIKLNTTVTALKSQHKKIESVEIEYADGQRESLASDYVISNTDPAHLYKDLLPKKNGANQWVCLYCFLVLKPSIPRLRTIRSGWGRAIKNCLMIFSIAKCYRMIFQSIFIVLPRPIQALRLQEEIVFML